MFTAMYKIKLIDKTQTKRLWTIFQMAMVQVAMVAFFIGSTSVDSWAKNNEVVEFAETEIFFEFNSTDNDLGIQIFFDAEGWKQVEVEDPEGDTIFEVENDEGLKRIGSTEVFTESAEPELDEDNLEQEIAEFQARFLEGTYYFKGKTITGKKLEGTADLAYALPAAPMITAPSDLPENTEDAYVISWEQPNEGPIIIGYEVVAELVFDIDGEERTLVNTAMLLPEVNQFTVSPEFVEQIIEAESGGDLLEFKVEVVARADNLNKTITERVIFEQLD